MTGLCCIRLKIALWLVKIVIKMYVFTVLLFCAAVADFFFGCF